MKYSINGSMSFGSNGSLAASDNAKGILGKIGRLFGSKAKETEESAKAGFAGDASFQAELQYELSAEISAEELVQLFKLSRENDIAAWDLMKTIGSDILKAEKAVRDQTKSALPQWQKIFHEADMEEERQEKELRDLKKSLKDKDEE